MEGYPVPHLPVCDGCKFLKDLKCQEPNRVILHESAEVINRLNHNNDRAKPQRKQRRESFIRQFKIHVSALRNSGGGIAFVHIVNLHPTDRSLDGFHEFVDERLQGMIEDGSLFVRVYKKDWLNEDKINTGVIAIVVSPSTSIVTYDFKSKLPLDSSVIESNTSSIRKLISQGNSFGVREATIRGLDYFKLRENRHIQVKAVIEKEDKFLNNIDKFVDYLWEGLRLREYITALSKLELGGSVFFGIEEIEYSFPTYKSTQLKQTGFQFLLSKENFMNKLLERIRSKTTILAQVDGRITVKRGVELVNIAFHPLPRGDNYFVLEVSISGVEGLVFSDSEGPEAYELDVNNNIQRISLDKWCRLLTKEFDFAKYNTIPD